MPKCRLHEVLYDHFFKAPKNRWVLTIQAITGFLRQTAEEARAADVRAAMTQIRPRPTPFCRDDDQTSPDSARAPQLAASSWSGSLSERDASAESQFPL